jgi:hypothetical protein
MSIPTFEYIEGGVYYRLWNCPIKFVPNSISQFFLIYNYHKEFQGASMPPFENTSNRFILACKVYNDYYADYLKLIAKERPNG